MRAISPPLPLPLLVARIRADDHGAAVPLDHATALTHRFDGRTDLHGAPLVAVAVGDTAAGQVVGRQLHLDLVARRDADVVLAHLPGDRGGDVVGAAPGPHTE